MFELKMLPWQQNFLRFSAPLMLFNKCIKFYLILTRKITRTRFNTHKYVKMRSLKYYSEDLYVKKLKEIDFPDYSNFKDINEAYSDFTGKVASVIDEK